MKDIEKETSGEVGVKFTPFLKSLLVPPSDAVRHVLQEVDRRNVESHAAFNGGIDGMLERTER